MAQIDPKNDPEFAAGCNVCHAPLIEQYETLPGEDNDFQRNNSFNPALQKEGITCAACHMREGQVFGPARKEERPVNVAGEKSRPSHAGFAEIPLFSKAEFCAACHQMEDGYAFNGKPLINTYNEWMESSFAKNGVVCQDCHMPDRRHLWRGIHDPDMTASALTIEASLEGGKARLAIGNTGAGHYFPTYATPLVEARAYLAGSDGRMQPGSMRKWRIGRMVSLDISYEKYDTRIPPGEWREFIYPVKAAKRGSKIVFEIMVHPDKFYAGFYAHRLDNGAKGKSAALFREALKKAKRNEYRLWRKEIPLP